MIDYEKLTQLLYKLTHSPEIEQKINKKILQIGDFFIQKGVSQCDGIKYQY